MRNWIKILIRISAIVLVVGIALGALGFFLRKGKSFSVDFKDGRIVTSDTDELVYYLPKTELESFDSVEIDVSYADVEFVTTDDEYAIEYSLVDTEPAYEVKDNKLIFSQPDRESLKVGLDFSFLATEKNNKVTIYIPAVTMSSVTINSSYGDVVINDLSVNSIDFDLSYGDVTCTNITVENSFNLSSSYGDFDVTNSALNNITADLSYGDIKLLNVEIAGNALIDDSFGDIEIGLNNGECSYDISTSMGDITINGVEVGDGMDQSAHSSMSEGASINISASHGDVSLSF